MTAECFLLIAVFFVMSDDELRSKVEESEIDVMEAVCFFGKVSKWGS